MYPRYIWVLVLCIIGAAAVSNVITMLWTWRRRSSSRQRSEVFSSSASAQTQRSKGFSMSRLPAATITASRIFAFRWRLPAVSMTFFEVMLTCIYIIALCTFCFANTEGLVLRYWANRSGHIAAAQFPLIIALASKNNAIGLLTGVGHEKLNLMHRVVSRVTLIFVWVHMWGRYVAEPEGLFSEGWLIAGWISTISMTVLTFISVQWIRKRFYETFYLSHMILVLLFVVTAWMHLAGAPPGFAYYLWPGVIVWGVDRFIRTSFYIIRNNIFKPSKSNGTFELISPDTLRLTIRRKFIGGWMAGQHAFLSFPSINLTQSHPFSISTLSESGSEEKELVFIIKAQNGLTKVLKDRVLERGSGVCDFPVFVDGPYGLPADISGFSTCVFIAGGTGITYVLPRFEDIIHRANQERVAARRLHLIWIVRDHVHLQWFTSRLQQIASTFVPGLSVTISLYVTGGGRSSGSALQQLQLSSNSSYTLPLPSTTIDVEKLAGSSEESFNSSTLEFTNEKFVVNGGGNDGGYGSSFNIPTADFNKTTKKMGVDVQVNKGRPDIKRLLECEVVGSEGAISVDVSGPSPLIRTVKNTLSTSVFSSPLNVLRGEHSIQLNVEEFRM
ncbi:ferric reductase NAD binding domain-containing protein [Abortiporus biennis]|nr:ferric reductase NAD binding domain-containing protein [Abortiporus biennis]